MLQPLYVFSIFVLKRNVINVILGRDKKKFHKRSAKTTKSTQLTKKSIIKNRVRNDSDYTNNSNPAFSITGNKDTDSSVILMSAQPCEEIPLTSPFPQNIGQNDKN